MDHSETLKPRRGGGGRGVRAAILAVLTVVFTGYLMLLVMMPTNTYMETWLPVTSAKTATTYFGTTQAATYLMFTLPLLFIAVLGSVYLHLHRNQGGGDCEHRFGVWRRPMIVKGLGIVSRIELAFFLMFLALLAWNLAMYFHNDAKITRKYAAEYGYKVWEEKLGWAGFRLGLVGNIALTFLFFPVTRGSSVLPLLGLTSEASIKYHIWLGHIVMTFFTAHGLCYIIFWAFTHKLSEMLKWDKTRISNLAGEISLLAGLMLWATAIPRIRRKLFELFFYTHHLYIVFVIFFVFHVGIGYTSSIMLPGFFLFMIDRFLRFLQSRKGVRLMSARLLPGEILELNFSKSKGLSYSPTSIMFVNVPSISKLQWHPFTISSCSDMESDKISVIIKGDGSWSRKLYQMLDSPSPVDRLDVFLEGPYGPISTDFLRHDLLVMISGGSGLTPLISIIREIMHMSAALKLKTPEVLLIASFKNSVDLAMLDLILPISGAPTELPDLAIKIKAYVTREKQLAIMQEKKPIRTIWFKPKPSDAPLTPILGQNNWLWLAAIVSSSFIIYLIFIGILTRYYIYPIDHNTNTVYPLASKCALHMLFLCIGVVISTTAVFLWNKNENTIETRQIRSMEGTTPPSTPSLSYHNADRELESFPQQPLWESVNMHYGERPDLKRLLFERKESSVGVVVSGPKQMRHEAAKICSVGLASNLHFESISFSW